VNISTTLKSTKAFTTGGGTGQQVSSGGDVKPGGVGVSTGAQDTASQSWGITTTGSGVWMGSFGVVLKVVRTPPVRVNAKIGYNQEGKFLSGGDGDPRRRGTVGQVLAVRRGVRGRSERLGGSASA
jgi:hypothetical protein